MISPEVSAARASSVVALLDALIHHEGNLTISLTCIVADVQSSQEGADDARTVSVFYTTSLAQVVGPPYKGPSLAILAWQWLEAKGSLQMDFAITMTDQSSQKFPRFAAHLDFISRLVYPDFLTMKSYNSLIAGKVTVSYFLDVLLPIIHIKLW